MRRSVLTAAVVAAAFLSAASLGASGKSEAQAQPATPGYGAGQGYGAGRMGRGMDPGSGIYGRGPGMDGQGPGMDGRGMMGDMRGMAGGRRLPQAELPLLDKPLTLDGAAERARAALTEWGYQDFAIAEVIQYSWSYYVLVKEKSTGKGAAELAVDPRTGVVGLEPGPAMMWNTRYGHMRSSGAPVAPSISADAAKKAAKTWLEQNGDNTAWEMELTEMYGYYTIHLVRDGRTEGILSVHASTGEVWCDGGHGPFVAAKHFAE